MRRGMIGKFRGERGGGEEVGCESFSEFFSQKRSRKGQCQLEATAGGGEVAWEDLFVFLPQKIGKLFYRGHSPIFKT
jgi:hypothetical protein